MIWSIPDIGHLCPLSESISMSIWGRDINRAWPGLVWSGLVRCLRCFLIKHIKSSRSQWPLAYGGLTHATQTRAAHRARARDLSPASCFLLSHCKNIHTVKSDRSFCLCVLQTGQFRRKGTEERGEASSKLSESGLTTWRSCSSEQLQQGHKCKKANIQSNKSKCFLSKLQLNVSWIILFFYFWMTYAVKKTA